MNLINLIIMYGHLEGAGGNFARDPTGYLSIAAGIFEKHGLKVSWNHVQGTEERYRRLADGSAHISLVVGRASLQHFLNAKTTKILGCAMNSCPYYLVGVPTINSFGDLKGKSVACREGPARNAPVGETFLERGRLSLGADLNLILPNGDQDAFNLLINGRAQAALLPRPFAFIAEEEGFKRIDGWPEIVDDPLPITIETTAKLWIDRAKDLTDFLIAHSEGIRYFKSHRTEAIGVLTKRFGHSSVLAQKTFDDCIMCMDETLKVDLKQFEKLLSQLAPEKAGEAREIAAQWIAPGAVRA